MKKIFYLFFVLSLALFVGCSDDDKDATFSKHKPEEHKKEIQKDAAKVVETLESIPELEAVQVISELAMLFEALDQPRVIAPVLKATMQMGDGTKFLASSAGFSISDEFAEIAGIYVLDEFGDVEEYTPSSDEFRVQFVSQVVGNCEFALYDFAVLSVSNELLEGEVEELPTSLKAYLKAGNRTLLEMSYSADFGGQDSPEKIDFTLSATPFTSSLSFRGSTSKMSLDFSFKEGKNNILGMHFDTQGNFDMDLIEGMFEADFDDEEEAFLTQEIIDKVNLWVAVGNLKTDAFVDFKGLKTPLNLYNDLNENSTKRDFEKIASGLNDNIKAYLRYNDSDKVIAKGEFYVYSDDFVGYSYLDYDFVFSDGSAISDEFVTETFEEYIDFIGFIVGDEDWYEDLFYDDLDDFDDWNFDWE